MKNISELIEHIDSKHDLCDGPWTGSTPGVSVFTPHTTKDDRQDYYVFKKYTE